jgi:pimeloyl-ACP methyl ester carboxylesterase
MPNETLGRPGWFDSWPAGTSQGLRSRRRSIETHVSLGLEVGAGGRSIVREAPRTLEFVTASSAPSAGSASSSSSLTSASFASPLGTGLDARGGGARRRLASRRVLVVSAAVGAGLAAGAAYRRFVGGSEARDRGLAGVEALDDGPLALGWGRGVTRPEHRIVRTRDGAELAVWDLPGDGPDAQVVVLPHCWGCSHEIWLPVARRLLEQGHHVVLYDQRGHGLSTRGVAPLTLETLAHDLSDVLESTKVYDVVLAGHSMGGMTIMSLAAHRPEVLQDRAKATVLVATAATAVGVPSPRAARMASALVASSTLSKAMRSRNGHLLVRGVFGANPERSHMDLTRELFGGCHGPVRGDFLTSFSSMNLVEGIATIDVPTTVIVGSRDTLTAPAKADQMVSTIPGARLVTLPDKGHMLPLEDPDAVTDEIVRAAKG